MFMSYWMNPKLRKTGIKSLLSLDIRKKLVILGFIVRIIFSFFACHPYDLPQLFMVAMGAIKGDNPYARAK